MSSAAHEMSVKLNKLDLNPPPLPEVSRVLQEGLTKHFESVDVSVVECPDLRQQPFHLAQRGLGGDEKIADVGGPPYLIPLVQREKYYSLQNIARLLGMAEKTCFIGPAAGPFKEVGVNSELMTNICFEDNQTKITNKTHFAKVNESGACHLSVVKTTDFGLMANLFACEGRPGNVLRVRVKRRIGSDNFVTAMRNILRQQYGDRLVSLGGVFLLRSGKAHLHIMPDFSCTPLTTDEEMNNWLNFYEMSSPLICLSVFHSYDPNLDLRVEHTHCFSQHNEGGHYHFDTTPDQVEYEGYFNLAKQVYRIDAPAVTHQIGRD